MGTEIVMEGRGGRSEGRERDEGWEFASF